MHGQSYNLNNNDNGLEHLSHTGPKHLLLHILLTVQIFEIQCIQYTAHTVVYQGNETEEKFFEKKSFQERFKRTDRGRMQDRNRELVPEGYSLLRELVPTTGLCSKDGILNTQVSAEERNCQEGV